LIGVINLAHEIGLTDGINGATNAPITRADMAVATENALFASYKWDKEEEELVEVDDGSASLIVKKHKWSKDDWADRAGVNKVTGKYDRITAGDEIRVDGKNYKFEDTDKVKWTLNKGDEKEGLASLKGQLEDLKDKDRDFTVTLYLKDDKVTKVQINADTYPNGDLTKVTIDKDEDDFGKVRVDGDNLKVDNDTEIFVNGRKATLRELQDALKDFQDKWGSDTPAIATVRTKGD